MNYLSKTCEKDKMFQFVKEETGTCHLWYHFDKPVHGITLCNATSINTFQFDTKTCDQNFKGRLQSKLGACTKGKRLILKF